MSNRPRQLYAIQVLRKSQPGSLNLNFDKKSEADEAFALLASGRYEATKVHSDAFGTKVAVDPLDVAHVLFIDVAGTMDMRVAEALMKARSDAVLNREWAGDPLNAQSGIVRPQAVPPGFQM